MRLGRKETQIHLEKRMHAGERCYLDHGRIGAGAQALHLAQREEAVLGGLALLPASHTRQVKSDETSKRNRREKRSENYMY